MAARLAGSRAGCGSGLPAEAERRVVRCARGGVGQGPGRAWLAGSEMDFVQDQDSDRPPVPQVDDVVGYLADAAASWRQSSGYGSSCGRTRRGGGGRLGEGRVAARGNTAAVLGAWVVFEDEAGFLMTPPTSRIWGRRGRAPVIRVRGRSQRQFSIAALCCYKPGERFRLIYRPKRHAGHTAGGARASPGPSTVTSSLLPTSNSADPSSSSGTT